MALARQEGSFNPLNAMKGAKFPRRPTHNADDDRFRNIGSRSVQLSFLATPFFDGGGSFASSSCVLLSKAMKAAFEY